jgi:CubicO group peptidase (beta-lactamase class C family)
MFHRAGLALLLSFCLHANAQQPPNVQQAPNTRQPSNVQQAPNTRQPPNALQPQSPAPSGASFARRPAGPPAYQLPVTAAIDQLKRDIPQLMEKADVPGLSIALIRNGKLVWTGAFGFANADTKKPVTKETIFEAASLSKPVFAYGVLKLVDKGKLDLDTPLNKYLGNDYDVVNDPRINLITARRVLSHTSGFPNWRSDQNVKILPINFTPGEKFSYSGEGMVYLSKVVEKITGMSLEDYMQQQVLQPLGMTSSSYIWQDRYDTLKAFKHDVFGHLSGRWKPEGGHAQAVREGGNAAASLATTAGDYARFLIAVLHRKGLKKTTWQQMLTPQIRVNEKYPPVAWGLGWGLETMQEGEYFWHWGDNGDAKAYITAFLPQKDAVVYFADGSNGLSFAKEILSDAIGGEHPALAHLDYERYNSPGRRLLKSIIAEGLTPALAKYKEQRRSDSTQWIDEPKINTIGYFLLGKQRIDDAIEIFRLNTEDFPGSWNAWDSLAEAYAKKGDKTLAIEYYEKSIALNPDNKNGIEQLKKLKP